MEPRGGRNDGGPPSPGRRPALPALSALLVIAGGFVLVLFVLPGGRGGDEPTSTTAPETATTIAARSTTAAAVSTTTNAAPTTTGAGGAWEWETVVGTSAEVPDHVTGWLDGGFVTFDVGHDGAWLWRSADGLAWDREPVPALGGLDPSYGLVSGATLWAHTYGEGPGPGTWWATTDGASWSEASFVYGVEATNVLVSPGLDWGGWGFSATSDAGARSGSSVVVPGHLEFSPDAEAMFGAGARLEWEWDTYEPAEFRVSVGDEVVDEVYFVRSVDGPTVAVDAFRLPEAGRDPDPATDVPLGRAAVTYPDGVPEGWQGGEGYLPGDFEPLQGLWVSEDGGATLRFLAMPGMLGTFLSPADVVVFDGRFSTILFEGMDRTTTSVGESVTATETAVVYRVASSSDGWNWDPGPLVTLDAEAAPRLLVLDGALLLGSRDGWLRSDDGERWDPIPLPGTGGAGVQTFAGGLVGFGLGGSSVFSYSGDLEHWVPIPSPAGASPAMCEPLVAGGTPIWVAPGIRQVWVARHVGEATTETGSASSD